MGKWSTGLGQVIHRFEASDLPIWGKWSYIPVLFFCHQFLWLRAVSNFRAGRVPYFGCGCAQQARAFYLLVCGGGGCDVIVADSSRAGGQGGRARAAAARGASGTAAQHAASCRTNRRLLRLLAPLHHHHGRTSSFAHPTTHYHNLQQLELRSPTWLKKSKLL